jgi:hypothetical protein
VLTKIKQMLENSKRLTVEEILKEKYGIKVNLT